MNGLWDILSVAIGVSFVFMILSILNSWIQDYVATIFHIRANNLADIMQVLLEPNAIKLDGKGMARKEPPRIEEPYADEHKPPTKYKTVERDTLSSVASEYKVSIVDLRNDNLKVLDSLSLKEGITLKIPELTYTVGKNDTLDEMAKKFRETTEALIEKNHEVFYEMPLKEETTLTISEVKHKVGESDTLNNVAAKYKVSGEELLKANIEALNKWLEKLKKESTDDSTNEQKQPDAQSPNDPAPSSNTKVDVPLGNIAQKAAQFAKETINPNLKFLDTKLPPDTTELTIPEFSYTVGKNETLNKIAENFKVSINKVSLPSGTEFTIPRADYTVTDSETLSKIAKDTNRSVNDLRMAKPTLFDNLSLPVGTLLNIPDPKAGRYKVQKNDKMREIALQHGISFDELQRKNPHVVDPLQPGVTLYIPKPEIGQMVSRKNVLSQLIANPVGSLYRHPIIHSLSKPGELPDRIPTKDFTVALLDLLDDVGRPNGKTPDDKISIQKIIEGIKKLEGAEGNEDTHPLAFRLRSLLHTAQINTQINAKDKDAEAGLEEFQKAVSEWFDDTVARGSVWYKRRMQRIGIIFGILLAVVLNADTIGISNALWHNAALRESLSQAADASVQQGQAPDSEQAQAQLDELISLGLPIGWSLDGNPGDPRAIPYTTEGWISKTIGLLLTGFAISQGSQLWFDLINRLINIRSSVPKSDTDESASKNIGK